MMMTGGCLCGKLRYEIEGEPALVGKCYCRDCQKESGTGHMTFMSFPADALTVNGEARTYTRKGASGHDVIRTFCPSCGTTIAGQPTILGEVQAVRAGTLDDPTGITATMAVYSSRAPTWDQPPSGLNVFPEMP